MFPYLYCIYLNIVLCFLVGLNLHMKIVHTAFWSLLWSGTSSFENEQDCQAVNVRSITTYLMKVFPSLLGLNNVCSEEQCIGTFHWLHTRLVGQHPLKTAGGKNTKVALNWSCMTVLITGKIQQYCTIIWDISGLGKKTFFILYTFSTSFTNVSTLELIAFFWYCFFIFYFLVHYFLWLCMGQFGVPAVYFDMAEGFLIDSCTGIWKYRPCQSELSLVFSINFWFYIALCLGHSLLIPHLCPLVHFYFTLILPHMYSYLSLMSTLGHGDTVPNGISNLCNPMLFLKALHHLPFTFFFLYSHGPPHALYLTLSCLSSSLGNF